MLLVFLKLAFDCNGRRFAQRHSDEKIGQRVHFECIIEMQEFYFVIGPKSGRSDPAKKLFQQNKFAC